VLSDRQVRISAATGGAPDDSAPAIDSRVYAIAGSLGASGSAGVSIAKATGQARVDVGAGARLGGALRGADAAGAPQPSSLSLSARRAGRVQARVLNINVSLGGALGATVAEARNSGSAALRLGDAAGAATALSAGTVALTAEDATRVSADSVTAAGGTLVGAAGRSATAVNG
jgi:hypothetical protein